MYQSSSNIIFIMLFLSINYNIIMHCSGKMRCDQFLNAIQLCYIYLDWQSRKWLISQLLLRWIKTIDMSHFVSLHLNPLLTGTEHSVKMVQYLSTESIWHTPVTVTHWPSSTGACDLWQGQHFWHLYPDAVTAYQRCPKDPWTCRLLSNHCHEHK